MSTKEAIKRARQKYRNSPKGKYYHQRSHAQLINIEWGFDFASWWKVWEESGHWNERGPLGYVMSRHGDKGPYSPENVSIKHHTENRSEAYHNLSKSMPNRWGKDKEWSLE